MALTPGQVYALARGAGFDPATATIMVAIGGAESGWNPDAVGDVNLQDATWGPSVGIWQVRSLHAQSGTGGPRDATRLKDPTFNASAAYSIFKSQGLGAWSTYSNGAFRSFLGTAAKAAGSGATAPVGTSSSATNAQAVDFAGGNWNPLNWPGAILGKTADTAAAGVWAQVQPFLITAGFASAGVALVVIGATVTAWPAAKKIPIPVPLP